MHTIQLPRSIVNKIMAQAQAKEELEVCGLISLNNDNQMKLFAITNTATDRSHFFEMDPAETIQAMKTMRNEESELFAIYHSHPSSPAIPSKTDIEKAGYPDALYLIVSLNTTGVIEIKGYKIQQDSVTPVDLII
ncbi:MAG: M67 family metallopeptidase [Gammaproteobacteria bacterium]|nr:M67 family metallopeptidase [Gammaproteobacteria bacterium]